eukprot:COSAG04_NODE_1956_length_5141_cov_4.223126_3_plen_64_part_00
MNSKQLDQAVKDKWITQKQRDKLQPKYLEWLIKTNRAKKHHPKPSLSAAEWDKKKKKKNQGKK